MPTKNREKKEDRLAREEALDGHWPITEGKSLFYPPVTTSTCTQKPRLQAAFSPVPDPSNYLSPLLPVSQWKRRPWRCFPHNIPTLDPPGLGCCLSPDSRPVVFVVKTLTLHPLKSRWIQVVSSGLYTSYPLKARYC